MLLLSFSLAVLGIKREVGALHSIPYPLLIDTGSYYVFQAGLSLDTARTTRVCHCLA